MGILTPSLSFGADTDLDFGTRFIPSNVVEDKEGMIHVFAKKGTSIVPEKIEGLTVTSLDSSILRVLTVKNSESGFVSEVVVKGVKAGTTKLFLASPGFSSLELPVTVFGNLHNQKQLLVNVVPDTFSSDGPFRGLVSVELVDSDGFPVKASEDVSISLNVANNNILEIFQKDLIIKKGEYFTGTHFIVKDSGKTGKTNIFAKGQGMEAKSNNIVVAEEDDLQVKLYLLQDQINVFGKGGNVGHIIAQLQTKDGDEHPVIAKKDIIVKYIVTNDILANQNTSPNANVGETTGTFKIKKGSYWGYTTFPLLGPVSDYGTTQGTSNIKVAGKYTVTISTGVPLSLDIDTVEGVFYNQNHANLNTPKAATTSQNSPTASNDGDKFVKFEGLPIFATGNKELLGLVFLEDQNDFPILANKNLEINIDSSSNDFVSIDPVFLPKGTSSALVFGQVGLSVPKEEIEINPVVQVEDESSTTTKVKVYGPEEESNKLVAKPLITKVLAGTEFPIVVYLTNKNEVTEFPRNSDLFISASEIFEVETKPVLRGDDLVMLNTKAIGKGKDKLQFTVNDIDNAEVTIESQSLKPANIVIVHSDTIFTGTNDVFSIELLNSENKPVFATEDIEINFVVNDKSIIQIPSSMVIKKGEYYTLFDAGPKIAGTTKISALAEGLPISTTDISIKSLKPELLLNAPDLVENQQVFTVKVTAKQDNLALSGLNVNWNVEGGVLQLSDTKTGKTGEAVASIMSTSDRKVDVKASVTGSNYSPSTISKTVKVNATSEFLAFAEEQTEFTKPDIGGIDPVIILVPAMIGLMGYMLFKKGAIKIKNPPATKQPQI
jgi:hypothetical protein